MASKKVFNVKDKNIKGKPNFNNYTHIRAYHACRPVDIAVYYQEGIKPLDKDEMLSYAASLFNKTPVELTDSGDSIDYEVRVGKVYFELYRDLLLRDAGHYLCYGSELLCCLAGSLDHSVWGTYHELLKTTGIPTLFACDIPVDLLSQSQLDDISRSYHSEGTMLGCWLYEPLPSEYIISHEHPDFIKNPIEGTFYRNKKISCPMCEETKKAPHP